jgi:DNA-binding XRE family transcriptional regulator
LSITQEEAAARLGVNAWTIHNWEVGETKPAIQFIPTLVAFLGYDPEPVDQRTLAGRLVAKRRELGLSQWEAARSLQIDPSSWAGWELGARIKREAHRRVVEGFLESPGTASQLAQGRGR